MASPAVLAPETIEVRNLHFDLPADMPRYWYDGDPARTHFMNALSSTFPAGEAFFVRSVQHFRDQIHDSALRERIRGFSGQEGVHSREHQRHVDILVAQGYPGILWLNRLADRELRFYNRFVPLYSLAVTAALEHLTAIMARQALSDPDYWASPMPENMARLWQWHAIEEAEHKAVAFDVFEEVSGSYSWRVVAMLTATMSLLGDNFSRWLYATFKDGNAINPRIWRDTASFLWGKKGLYRRLIPDYVRWYRRGFHPSQQDDQALILASREKLAI
jgi:predicted metal-dependent hydrolase